MGPVSARELAEWVAEARERWSVPGLAVGRERLTFRRHGFVCIGVLAMRTE